MRRASSRKNLSATALFVIRVSLAWLARLSPALRAPNRPGKMPSLARRLPGVASWAAQAYARLGKGGGAASGVRSPRSQGEAQRASQVPSSWPLHFLDESCGHSWGSETAYRAGAPPGQARCQGCAGPLDVANRRGRRRLDVGQGSPVACPLRAHRYRNGDRPCAAVCFALPWIRQLSGPRDDGSTGIKAALEHAGEIEPVVTDLDLVHLGLDRLHLTTDRQAILRS